MNKFYLYNFTSIVFPMLNLVILSLFVQARKVLAVDDNFKICSVPTYCGRLEIKYPFFINEPRCGLPEFNISCRNKRDPIIRLRDGDYVIHNIFYENQSFNVSKALDKDAICRRSIQNTSFPEDGFYLPRDQRKMVLLFDCQITWNSTTTTLLSRYKVNCTAENQTSTTLALFSNDPQLNLTSSYCNKTIEAPVSNYARGGDVEDILNSGFVLNWRVGNCSICEESAGKCGFDYSTYHFKCFCPDRPHAWHCTPGKPNLTLTLKVGLGIGGFIVLLILMLSIFVFLRRYKHKYDDSPEGNTSSDPCSKSDLESTSTVCFGLPIFSYSELVEATNNFDDDREVGDGGFGIVYFGKLQDGREVAIKRLYQHNYRRREQFINEIEILTRLRHKNLVSLFGCTSRRSRELLLVYEYVPNGTVADHLHGDLAQSSSLTWPIRINIATETASALAYLHASDIVHRDVKTNNILLDHNFSVKVADFGLSRLFPNDVTHISTAPQGTPGYVDPEYHQCYQLTEKSDVYSFGVVLVELISSKPAVDFTRHSHEINLANLAINKIKKCAFDELIDPNLGYKSDARVKRMITLVTQLAFQCLQQAKEMRPTMEEVLKELRRIQCGDYKLEKVEVEQADSKVPSPSPPTGDQIVLLKNIRLPPSPISVTDKWVSQNSTPNARS